MWAMWKSLRKAVNMGQAFVDNLVDFVNNLWIIWENYFSVKFIHCS
jgi:hypothetical protein